MKTLIAPDSYKGTLTADEAARCIAAAFASEFPDAELELLPLADGGEGTCAALAACGGRLVYEDVCDGYGSLLHAAYCIYGDTAVIESASAAGYKDDGPRKPEICSTYGVGLIARAALAQGCRKLAFSLGGTGSNDGGCGLAAALGVKFYDAAGESFVPNGVTLARIDSYDLTDAQRLLNGTEVTAFCDVSNPFFGERGAARVFAPQKGAGVQTVEMLDAGMKSLAGLVLHKQRIDLQSVPGAGAAGGLGGAVCAFLGGRLVRGIDEILRLTRFTEKAASADLIITGEGATDEQTLMGKTVLGVLSSAGGTPVITLSGCALPGAEALYDCGLYALGAVNRAKCHLEEIKANAAATLRDESLCAAKLIKLGCRLTKENIL